MLPFPCQTVSLVIRILMGAAKPSRGLNFEFLIADTWNIKNNLLREHLNLENETSEAEVEIKQQEMEEDFIMRNVTAPPF